MSLQWALIAGFLYTEIAIVVLLLLPVISPARWQKIFRSRFLNSLSSQASLYFTVLLGFLCLFLLDAIREIRKYSGSSEPGSDPKHQHLHLDTEMQGNMRLFRAQRNFYISGFALFLCLVIRRLTTLISTQATLMAENAAALQQARSATTTARNLMTEKRGAGEEAQNNSNEVSDLKEQVKEKDENLQKLTDALDAKKKELKELHIELEKIKKNNEALVSQQTGLSREYDRLADENSKLQKIFDSTNKKSD
uniref:Endoplasmic reticulum transmembrane protein n=1 Tax=Franklinothrips vespiformis TaxID=297892 RepID=A0A481SX85_FRAVS|nr:bcr-associated protein [Franklinothrips vespiformis]